MLPQGEVRSPAISYRRSAISSQVSPRGEREHLWRLVES
jgi:hypothetical protein